MNVKTLIPLVVALGLGLVAAVMGKSMMGRGTAESGPGMKMAKQVVAKADLAPGSTIQEADVVLRDLPADVSGPHAFGSVGDVVGRVVTTQIVKGQAVMQTLLAPAGAMAGLPAMIPPGMRAVTLEVNEVSGLAGLLTPGSSVDLVQTIKAGAADDAMMAKTIVENLRVLAVGKRTSTIAGAAGPEGDPVARSVTLLASAAEAEAIDLASHVGSPRLVLRNSYDREKNAAKGVTVATLRGEEHKRTREADELSEHLWAELLANGGGEKKPDAQPKVEQAKAEPKKAFREVEVIRGGQSTSVRVGVPGGDSAVTKLFGDAPQEPIDQE